MDENKVYATENDSEGNKIYYGDILVDEEGTEWEVVRHPHLPVHAPYIKCSDDVPAIPYKEQKNRKNKWFVVKH